MFPGEEVVEETPIKVKEKKKPAEEKLIPFSSYVQILKSGKVIPIEKPLIRIGRFDPVTGVRPELDLSREELGKSVSRRHAKLIYKDDKIYLVEEVGVLNTTTINGIKVETGVLNPLQDGDELTIGAVKLLFKQGAPSK